MNRQLLAFIVAFLLPIAAAAQTVAELERQLPQASPGERGRILATLTDLLRQDNPRKAIEYGEQALAVFAQRADPPNHVKTLNEMAWAYMTLSDYDNAIAFAGRGRELAERTGDERGRARAINNLGVIAQRRGDALEAVEHFQASLEILRRLNNDLDVSMALNNLGFTYATDLADYETGLAYHVEALAVREKLGDKAAISLSLNNIGIVYSRLGEHDRALKYLERALALRRETGVQGRIAGTLNNIGDVWLDKGDLQKATDYHRQALDLRRKIGDKANVALSLRSLGVINTRLRRFREARAQLEEALALSSGDHTGTARMHLALAALDREQGLVAPAIDRARQALDIATKTQALELQRQAWQELAASYEQAGNADAALRAFKSFKQINDEIFNTEKARRVETLERRYQAERREAEIQHLQAQQAIGALALSQQRYQRNAIVAGAIVLGLVGFGIYRRRVEAAEIAHRLSITDALTGLRNRRYVAQTIDADTAVSARKLRVAGPGGWSGDGHLVFMLVDIDHFKSVNDRFGHDAGDRVLVQMAEVLRGASRASDTVARWGGEEFLVIYRFTNRDTAAASAERIRSAVERHVFDIGGGGSINCTCSVGFASFPFFSGAPDAVSWEQVIAAGDRALYLAKQSGRNAWAGVREGAGQQPVETFSPAALGAWIAAGQLRIESSRPVSVDVALDEGAPSAAPQPA